MKMIEKMIDINDKKFELKNGLGWQSQRTQYVKGKSTCSHSLAKIFE